LLRYSLPSPPFPRRGRSLPLQQFPGRWPPFLSPPPTIKLFTPRQCLLLPFFGTSAISLRSCTAREDYTETTPLSPHKPFVNPNSPLTLGNWPGCNASVFKSPPLFLSLLPRFPFLLVSPSFSGGLIFAPVYTHPPSQSSDENTSSLLLFLGLPPSSLFSSGYNFPELESRSHCRLGFLHCPTANLICFFFSERSHSIDRPDRLASPELLLRMAFLSPPSERAVFGVINAFWTSFPLLLTTDAA